MARITPQSQTCGTTLLPPLSQESPAAPQPGPGQSLWPAHWLLPTALPTQTEPPSLVSLDCRSLLEPEHLSDGLNLGPGHIPEEESRRQEAGSSSVSPGVTFIKMPPRKFPKETKGRCRGWAAKSDATASGHLPAPNPGDWRPRKEKAALAQCHWLWGLWGNYLRLI